MPVPGQGATGCTWPSLQVPWTERAWDAPRVGASWRSQAEAQPLHICSFKREAKHGSLLAAQKTKTLLKNVKQTCESEQPRAGLNYVILTFAEAAGGVAGFSSAWVPADFTPAATRERVHVRACSCARPWTPAPLHKSQQSRPRRQDERPQPPVPSPGHPRAWSKCPRSANCCSVHHGSVYGTGRPSSPENRTLFEYCQLSVTASPVVPVSGDRPFVFLLFTFFAWSLAEFPHGPLWTGQFCILSLQRQS